MQERPLLVRRHDQQPVGLRRPRSRPWRGTSCARHRPRSGARPARRRRAAAARAISVGRARDPAQPADVEERLVDREPFDERRRVREHLEHRLARLGVGGEPRRHDDRPRAELRGPRRSPIAVRTPKPWPRSWPRARRHRRRSPADRAAGGRRAARPRRRTRRGRRGGSWHRTRTYVRTSPGLSATPPGASGVGAARIASVSALDGVEDRVGARPGGRGSAPTRAARR